jgi:Glycosyltransferase
VSNRKPRLLLIFPGPHYDIDHDFRARLELLSTSYEGIVLTSTPSEQHETFGAFQLITCRISDTGGMRDNLRFFAMAIAFARAERSAGRPIDLVITYDPLKSGILGVLVARILRAKLVVEVNGNYAAPATYVDMDSRLRATLIRRTYTAIEKWVVRRSAGVKLLYPDQLDFCQPLLTGRVVRSFFDFVDLRPFRDLGEEKLILFAGFPFFLKGVDVLIRAFLSIAPAHPDWKLKILGWYPKPIESYFALAKHPQIFHHPPVHHREMPDHMGVCAMLVLPSRSEAMGRVLLEAMAAAKPRIGARVGGVSTVIEHGVDGFLFDSEDVDQLARLIESLIEDPALRKTVGERGHARAREQFTVELYLEKVEEFYGAVLAS